MLVLIGIAVVTLSVFVGFFLAGGPLLLMIQPVELLIIGGAAAGTLLIGSTPSVLRQLLRQTLGSIKPTPYSRALYIDCLQLLYELLVKAKKNGLIALERDLAEPHASPIFSAHPALLAQHHVIEFTSEALGMLVDGTMRPEDFETVLDAHLETHHEEERKAAGILAKIGDALPGLGIVAAVLGIVITMQHVDGKPEEIGHHVAVALIGTFMGILLSYGYVQPLSSNLEGQAASAGRFLLCIKNALVAFARGAPPLVAVEVARHVIFSDERPSASELAEACRSAGSRAAAA
ncbi:MAG TPA: flagellar motor stator protein MotA [Terriglobales bacterium]|nr:flagellar motor stator protein MotA [Terriglobales bacterium]